MFADLRGMASAGALAGAGTGTGVPRRPAGEETERGERFGALLQVMADYEAQDRRLHVTVAGVHRVAATAPGNEDLLASCSRTRSPLQVALLADTRMPSVPPSARPALTATSVHAASNSVPDTDMSASTDPYPDADLDGSNATPKTTPSKGMYLRSRRHSGSAHARDRYGTGGPRVLPLACVTVQEMPGEDEAAAAMPPSGAATGVPPAQLSATSPSPAAHERPPELSRSRRVPLVPPLSLSSPPPTPPSARQLQLHSPRQLATSTTGGAAMLRTPEPHMLVLSLDHLRPPPTPPTPRLPRVASARPPPLSAGPRRRADSSPLVLDRLSVPDALLPLMQPDGGSAVARPRTGESAASGAGGSTSGGSASHSRCSSNCSGRSEQAATAADARAPSAGERPGVPAALADALRGTALLPLASAPLVPAYEPAGAATPPRHTLPAALPTALEHARSAPLVRSATAQRHPSAPTRQPQPPLHVRLPGARSGTQACSPRPDSARSASGVLRRAVVARTVDLSLEPQEARQPWWQRAR